MYSALCILKPPRQPEKYGLKLEVVLKWKDSCNKNIGRVSLVAGLEMEGIVIKMDGSLITGTTVHP